MGYLAGTAVSDSGDSIRVTFNCHALAERTLNIISANISVDGEADYTAVQYARASVTLLTEGTELLPLCTSVGTAVIIENLTTKSVLFSGYVTQNTFTQQLITDTLTVECVDKLGYSMYKPVPELSLIQCNTLAGWCAGFGNIMGVKNVYLSTAVTLRRRSDGKETPRYYRMTFPGDYFLKNTKPDVINDHATYAKQKMTMFEALTMIAESLRMTFVQVGEDLYLEEPSVTSDIRSYINASTYLQHDIVLPATALTEESFGGTDNSVTTLPVYTLFSLRHGRADSRSVTLPIFDDEFLRVVGGRTTHVQDDKTTVSTKLASILVSTMAPTEEGDNATFVAWKTYDSEGYDASQEVYNNNWNKAIRMRTDNYDAMLITIPSVLQRSVAAAFGRGVKINISMQITDDVYTQYPASPIEFTLGWLTATLRVGNLYYNGTTWVGERVWFDLRVRKEDGSTYAWNKDTGKKIDVIPLPDATPGDTTIELSLGCMTFGKTRVIYITDLEVAEVVQPQCQLTEAASLKSGTEELGTYEMSREYGEVTLPIDLYYLSSEKTFGTNIGGTDYADGTEIMGAELRFGSSKMSMIEKIQAVATRGGGTQYNLTLRDDHNSVRLQQKYQASFFEGEKGVVAYEKNLLDNTTKITII